MKLMVLGIMISIMLLVSGCNNPSGGSVVSRGHTPLLQPPGAFQFTQVRAKNGTVYLRWSGSRRVSEYKVYQGSSASAITTEITSCAGVLTDCTISGLDPNTTYWYSVTSTNAAGTQTITSPAPALSVSDFNITSTSISNGSIQLSWGASNNATQYNIQYGFSPGVYSNTVQNVTSPYTLTGLSNYRTHYFRVIAVNASNGYAESDSEGSETPIGPPDAPTGLAVSAGTGIMSLSWNNVPGAISYKVFRGTSSGSLSEIGTVVGNSYNDETITDGITYYYAVKSTNPLYDSVLSAEVFARSVANFSIISANPTQVAHQILVTWGAATGATSYSIRYGTSPTALTNVINNVTSPYVIPNLVEAMTYYVRVYASNSVGPGSTTASTNTMSSTTFPAKPAPSGVTASASPGQITINWNSVDGALNYELVRGTSSGVYTVLQSSLTGTSYTDTSVSNGTAYYYALRSFNGLYSGYSLEVAAKPISPFSISSVTSPNSSSIQLNWTAASGADAYDVRYGTSPGSYTSTASGVTSPYTLTGLTSSTTYYIVVRARNAIGTGTNYQTAESSVQTKSAVPTGLVASATPSQVSLNWDNTTGASSYTVYRGTTSGSYPTVVASGLLTSDYVDTTVTNGTTYYYVVTATNASESSFSNEVAIRSIASFSIAGTQALTPTSIEVTWPAVTGAATYDISYGTSSGNYTTTLTNKTSPATLSSLTGGITYYIKVVAKNAVGTGTSLNSPEVIQVTPVAPPSGVAATVGNDQVTLSWNSVAGASSYKIYRGESTGVHTLLASNIVPTSYVDSTVSPGTQYFYVIKSYNGVDSASSSEVTGKSIASWAISSVTSPTATSLEVTFPSTAGGDLYDIGYGTSSGSYTYVSGVTSPHTLSSLSANTTYYIVARARNSVGSGASRLTAEVSLKTLTATPAGLAAVSSPGSVSLSWGSVSGASSYKIYRGATTGVYSEIASGVATNSYIDTTASNGTTYFYAIKAFNGSDSAYSNEVTTRPIEAFAISSTTALSPTSVEVTWPTVTGASSYDVRLGTSSGNYTQESLNATSPLTITGLTANTTYYIVVRAKNAVGAGTTYQSAESSLKTPTLAPTGLVATASPGQVGLNWTAVTGAASYKIYRGTSSGTYSELATGVGTNAYLDTTVSNGTTYFYAVKAFNSSDSGYSNEVSLSPIGSFSLTSATAASATSINLAWGSATGATSYEVRYGTSSGVYLGTVTNATSPYTLGSLSPNTQYFISIRAVNTIGSGASSNSNELNATTGTAAPASLVASVTSGQIALSWAGASGASSYRVYRGTNSGDYTQIASGVTSTSYTDTTVSNGTQYFYVVRAFNGVESASSNEVTGLPLTGFSITSTSAPTTTTIQVVWPSVTGAASFDVKYATVSGGPYTTVSNVTSPYTISGLSANTTYYIVVDAKNAVGPGTTTSSNQTSQITPLGAPSGLASSATPGSVSLTWNAVAGASSYKIYRGTSSGSHSELATGVTTNSYTDSGVSNGTTYYYVVSAYNGSDSLVSNETSIRPVASFTITSATPASSTQINVSWPSVTGAASYDVKYGTTTGVYTTTLTNQTSPAALTSLTPGASYYIVVIAKNAVGAGTSYQSPEVGATTAFGAPAGLVASATPGQVSLSWNAVSGATSYKVYRGTSSGSYSEIESNATTNSYTDTSVSNGTTYYYAVVAFNGASSPYSNEASVRPVSSFTFSSASTASASEVNLSWTAATGAATYDVRYGTAAGSYTTTLTNVTSPYSVTGLSAGTTYYFQVQAKNAVGSGTTVSSSELNAKTSPGAPSSLAASATTGQIGLSWSAVAGATNYNVYRSATSGSGYVSLASGVSSTSYTDTTIANGTQYYYVVRANNGTESVNSNEATGQSIASFAISSTSAPTSTTIQVTWPATAGASTYDIRYGTSSGSYSTTVTGVTSPYTITSLTSATTYYIVVRANNSIGSGSSAQTSEVSQITPLGAPTGLAATATPGSVSLSWNNVAGASSYKVYRGTSSGSHSLLASGVSTNSYTDTVTNGTQYYYVVKAFNGADSANSNEATILPIASFSISSTSSPSSSSVQVTWSAPAGGATYDVRYGTSSGVYSTTVTGVSSPYTITDLNPGTTYYIVIRAINAVGAGTQVTSAQTTQLTALAAPTGLVASATPGSVGLNWNSQSGVTTYKVYRGTVSGTLSFLANAASNAYMDTTAVNGTTYYYAVLANNGTDSALSSEVAVRPIASFSLTAATASSASTINLTWDSASGAASYDVRYGTSPGVYLTTVTGVTSPYTLSGLSSGTTYYVSIQAQNAVGAGTIYNSNELNAKTAVGAPSGLAAVSSPASVALSWGAVSGATNYNVYRSGSTGGPYSQITSAVTGTSYTDTTVSNGTTYYYVVRSFNGIESANSSEVATQPIASFTLAAGTVNSSTQATVSWGAATGATTYDVRIGTVSGTYTTTYTNVTSPYVITGLSASTLYYVVIRANNSVGAGTSLNSNQISFTTSTAAPTTLAAAVATGQINLTWSAASGATNYRIYRSTTSGSGYTQIASGITSTNYSDTTVVNGIQYYYVVRAFNGTESANSNEATGLPIAGFSIASTSAPTTTTIEVTWPATAGASAYDVRYGTSTATYSSTATGVTSPYTITGLSANTTYYIVVRARNTTGSGTSATTPEVTQITPVAAPTGLIATGGTSRVDLSWTAASGASSYKIFRGTVSGSLSQIASGVAGTTYADTTAVNGTQYYYAIKSFNGSDSALSSEVTSRPISSFSISSVTGPSTTSISVAWGSATGASTYDLKYGTVSGTYTTTLTNVTSPYVVTGLTEGVTYFVQMVAKNAIGTGTSVNSAQSSGATNSAPSLTTPADQTSDGSAKAVAFTLADSNDLLTCAGAMSGSSTNTTLVPNANIVFSGTIPSCTATITPAVNQTGITTITLTASDGKDSTSTSFYFTVTGCTVADIVWTQQPTNINAGANFATAPRVELKKADGTRCTNNSDPVSLEITTDNSTQQDATMGGTFSVVPVNGFATFPSATITRAGANYQIAASQGDITSADSNTFTVSALAPTRLAWSVQPQTSNRTAIMVPNPQLRVADIYGNYPASFNTSLTVTITLGDNTEGATFGGTKVITNSTGIFTFTNLTVNLAGSYFIQGTTNNAGYTVNNSNPFTILNITPVNTVAVLEMLTGPHVHNSPSNSKVYPGFGISIGTNHIDGTPTYVWKIVASNTDSRDTAINLRLGTTNLSTITVPRNTPNPTAYQQTVTGITADNLLKVRLARGIVTVFSSTIIVTQTNATKSMVFVPLTSTDNSSTTTPSVSTMSTTLNVPNEMNFPVYNWDGAKISRIDSAALHVSSRANACVALWNNTTNTQVGAEVCNASASDSIVSVEIPASSLPAGTAELQLRMRSSTGSALAHVAKGGILLRLVSIEKMLAIQRTASARANLTADSHFNQNRARSYRSGYSSGATVTENYVCRARNTGSGSGNFILRDHGANTSGTTTTNALATNIFSSSSFSNLEQPNISTTNNNYVYTHYTHTSGTLAVSHCFLETEAVYP